MSINDANGTETHLAGKLLIPDLTALHGSQQHSFKAMQTVTSEVAAGFAEITKSQSSFLNQALAEFEKNLKRDIGSSKNPVDLSAMQERLSKTEDLSKSMETISQTVLSISRKSSENVIKAVEQSMAKIDLAATKFSGG
ncbi:hypothetical protein [Sneathiella limimaris]|uniref:hypothetical protein n=1 Tax=Sneathiella limimaris TaxID=1964213 RepID=UPI00146F0ACE|nr:hypothetical protein [Sneathiella limimaris]